MVTLALKDIYFGKVDAKNELLDNTVDQRRNFRDAFLLPGNFNIDAFKNGNKYIICGLKGTGKTAFLRYLSILLEEQNFPISFILFKTEFTEDDKKDFSKAAHIIAEQSQFSDLENDQDFELIWKWFFFQHIIDCCEKKDIQLFEHDENWSTFKNIVKSLDVNTSKFGLNRFIPKIKKGEVELKIGYGKIGFDLEFDDSRRKVKFNQFVKHADKYFQQLAPVGKNLYIFLDELELAYSTKKNYERDARLIRDLLISVNSLNSFCRSRSFPIYIITSVRSEVLTAVAATGKEINKIVEDFGMLISWHQAGGDLRNHPLIQIVLKRLELAEIQVGNSVEHSALWQKYFPEIIQGKRTEGYILFNSWYRPRDLVRLLIIAQELFPNAKSLSHDVFDGIRKTYSTRAWSESLEELRAIYNLEELDALYHILCGWKKDFAYEEMLRRINHLSSMYNGVESLRTKTVPQLLHNLYNAGVIGNKYFDGNKVCFRFIFRGDERLLIDRGMMVHNALIPYLQI